jgi:hypothetical protein
MMSTFSTVDFARQVAIASAAFVCVAPTSTFAEAGVKRPPLPKTTDGLRSTSRGDTELGVWPQFVETTTSATGSREVSIARQTSEQERVIAELRRWKDWEAGWDGEGATTPNVTSINCAIKFVCEMDREDPMPEPMLHGTGEAGLFWNEQDLYGDLKFLGDGRVAYFVRRGESRHKGIVDSSEVAVLAVLHPLLFPSLAVH